MTKKILLLLILPIVFISSAYAQKDVENIPNFDKQKWHWGYYLGVNMYDFKISPTLEGMTGGTLGFETEIIPGFSVGLIGVLRLNDYFELRIEPGLDITRRNLTNTITNTITKEEIKISSNYVNLPLLLKFGGKRSHNIRPYLIAGGNLSFNQAHAKDDTFKMTSFNYSWQAGAGIDWYTPYAKISTEIRGAFGINDEKAEKPEDNIWSDYIDKLQSRSIFLVIKIE
jgi:opacity protein-like surface antigen